MRTDVYVFCDLCGNRVPDSCARKEVTLHKYGPQIEEIICSDCDHSERHERLCDNMSKGTHDR